MQQPPPLPLFTAPSEYTACIVVIAVPAADAPPQHPASVARPSATSSLGTYPSWYRAGRHINCNETTGCRTCLVSNQVQAQELAHRPQNSCRWIVELMPELAVVAMLEYELAVVLELLSLFVSRRA